MTSDWQPITPDEVKLMFERPLDGTSETSPLGFAEVHGTAGAISSTEGREQQPFAKGGFIVVLAASVLIGAGLIIALVNRSESLTPSAAPLAQEGSRQVGSETENTASSLESTTIPLRTADLATRADALIVAPMADLTRSNSPVVDWVATPDGNPTPEPVKPQSAPATAESTTTTPRTTTTAQEEVVAPTDSEAQRTTTTAAPEVVASTESDPPRTTTTPTTSPEQEVAPNHSSTSSPTESSTAPTSTTEAPSATTTVMSTTPGPACHPAYSGECVPFASDVDCAKRGRGRGGNGPEFVAGPFTVVDPDTDPYDLDPDGDGIACDR